MTGFADILNNIQNGKIQPLYTLHGEESYFIDQLTEALEANAVEESQRDFNMTVLYGKDTTCQTIMECARRLPVMSPRQLVMVKEAQQLKNANDLLSYVQNLSNQTVLCLAFKKNLDMRTKLALELKKRGVVFQARKLYENQVPDWIEKWVSNRGFKINAEAKEVLVTSLGTDLSKIVNELDKLFLNLKKGSTISANHIQEYIGISKDYNIFELNRALGTKDHLRIFRIVNYMQSNIRSFPFPMVLGGLHGYFSRLYKFQLVKNAPEKTQLATLGVRSAWFLKEYKLASQNYNRAQLEVIFEVLASYDLKSKGVNSNQTSQESLVQEMILKIIQ